LQHADTEAAAALAGELRRQATTLSLIASENHCSSAVREATASVITDKYAEGYPGARYYGGCEFADRIENLARDRALRLFPGAEHANVQPHSGTGANLAVLAALVEPKGRIVGMALHAGGHLSHGFGVSMTGTFFDARQYGVRPDTGLLDYDEVRRLVREHRPRVVIGGGSSYPRTVDYELLRQIADEVEALVLADVAHPAGLIAGGVMPSPLPWADVVTMTTHKTLRGPRGGMILSRRALAGRIDKAVFPGTQGGPLMHQIAGKAVAFGEALRPEFRAYQERVLANARRLAASLADRGLDIVTGGTDSHMVVVNLVRQGVTGADVEARALAAGLAINKNMIPNDPRKPKVTSGVRVGTAAVTSRGMGLAEMDQLAEILHGLVAGLDPASFGPRVAELCRAFPLPK
jgi:glycine hydroxymethyltransferase